MSEWFPANAALRQGCVMSLLLFNVYMDGVDREVNARVLGKALELLSVNCGRFEINQLLFADDTALVTDSEEKLCILVRELCKVYERRKFRVNVHKSKGMRCSRYGNGGRIHQSIYTKRSRRKLNAKKIIAHDDVTHGAMARKILKKIIDLATRIELTLSVNIITTTKKLAEKLDHLFSHLFIFSNIFAQVTGSTL